MNIGEKVVYKGATAEVTSVVKSGWLSIMLESGDTRKVRLSDVKRAPKVEKAEPKAPDSNPRVAAALAKAKEAKPEAERVAKAPAGPQDNGDEIATKLRDCADLNAVYALAAVELAPKFAKIGVAPENVESLLRQRYSVLNPGQQRMVLGNLMRGWLKEQANPKPDRAAERAAAKAAKEADKAAAAAAKAAARAEAKAATEAAKEQAKAAKKQAREDAARLKKAA